MLTDSDGEVIHLSSHEVTFVIFFWINKCLTFVLEVIEHFRLISVDT